MTKLSQTRASKLPNGRHHDGLGLYLLARGENRSWLFRYELFGKERWMGLGRFADVTLEEARDAARDARKKLLAGGDPIAERRELRAGKRIELLGLKSFREAAAAYYEKHSVGWIEKHRNAFHQRMNDFVYPKLGSLPIKAIDGNVIADALEPIWIEKNATAQIVRGLIEKVLDHAKVEVGGPGIIRRNGPVISNTC
jgi:hypothetical protein